MVVAIFLIGAIKFKWQRKELSGTETAAVMTLCLIGAIPYVNFAMLLFIAYIHLQKKEV